MDWETTGIYLQRFGGGDMELPIAGFWVLGCRRVARQYISYELHSVMVLALYILADADYADHAGALESQRYGGNGRAPHARAYARNVAMVPTPFSRQDTPPPPTADR